MFIVSVFGVLRGTKCRVPAHMHMMLMYFYLFSAFIEKKKTGYDAIILTLMITENFPIPLSILYHIPVEKSENETDRILERLEKLSGETHISVLYHI